MAACELLDEEHLDEKHPLLLIDSPYNNNAYIRGRIGDYNIVIVYLLKGRYNITLAISVAKDMLRSFESIWFRLIVGIGGGAPSGKNNIRLRDIVIDCPIKKEGGIVFYNFNKAV